MATSQSRIRPFSPETRSLVPSGLKATCRWGKPHMLVAEPGTCRWTAKEFDRETLAIGVFEAKTVVYLMHPSTAPLGTGPAPTSSGGASTRAAAPPGRRLAAWWPVDCPLQAVCEYSR
ncbi:hypothetical protein GCM10023085_57870 [Actinomadura viridis]